MKQEIWRNYPVGDKVRLVERLLERGVVDDGTRPITRNRQPGRCCDHGCTQPGRAIMVPLPSRSEGEERRRGDDAVDSEDVPHAALEPARQPLQREPPGDKAQHHASEARREKVR